MMCFSLWPSLIGQILLVKVLYFLPRLVCRHNLDFVCLSRTINSEGANLVILEQLLERGGQQLSPRG